MRMLLLKRLLLLLVVGMFKSFIMNEIDGRYMYQMRLIYASVMRIRPHYLNTPD